MLGRQPRVRHRLAVFVCDPRIAHGTLAVTIVSIQVLPQYPSVAL